MRERPEDILPLADMFLKASAEALGRTVERISTPAQELLLQYPWPGNAGELAQWDGDEVIVEGCTWQPNGQYHSCCALSL